MCSLPAGLQAAVEAVSFLGLPSATTPLSLAHWWAVIMLAGMFTPSLKVLSARSLHFLRRAISAQEYLGLPPRPHTPQPPRWAARKKVPMPGHPMGRMGTWMQACYPSAPGFDCAAPMSKGARNRHRKEGRSEMAWAGPGPAIRDTGFLSLYCMALKQILQEMKMKCQIYANHCAEGFKYTNHSI